MDISIHQAERIDRRGRRLIAVAVLAAIAVIASSWVGLLALLSGNAAAGSLDDLSGAWVPNVSALTLDLPDLGRLSEVYTADGVQLGRLTERNSQPVPLEEIPDLVVAAVLSAEDADYWTHPGIDHQSIIRALVSNVGGGIANQGGSTITQQVVKQNFIGTEPTLRRKVSEAAIAMELERRFTKEQILEFYLNSVYFGANAYRVQAAAQEYFGKTLDQLSIAEAAALVVPIRNPTLYNLRNRTDDPVDARDRVIGQMVEEGYITEEEAADALDERLVTVPHQEFQTLAPQVLIAAKEAVLNDPGFGLGDTYLQRKRALFGCPADDTTCEGGGGLRIYVTVDYALQQQAQELLQQWFPPGEEGPTGAIAMVDNRTGATVVMASGLEFGEDIQAGQRTYDIATKGRRNPGSAFKPFGLVAAMENGYPLHSYWADSSPQILDYGGAEPWVCHGGPTAGTIRTLEQATIASTNSVFCQLAVRVGAEKISEVAHRMGIKSPLGNVPAIVLGASAVSPLEMAAGYSTLANYGSRVENYLIERIEDAEGNVVYQHRAQRTRVLDAALAAAVVNTMEQAVSRGTGGNAWIGRPQAGKTGTHQDHTDVWFVGFIPQFTTSVWVGFPDRQVEMRNIVINGTYYDRVWGSSVAAPIWADFMEIVTARLPVMGFPPDPEGIEAYYQTPREEVPDVIGMELENARDELYEAGFDVEWEYVNSDEPRDDAVTQDPEHPTKIKQGEKVKLEVSNGRTPEAIMPNLAGMDLGEALARLETLRSESEVDFTWELVSVATADPGEHNKVVGTRPGAGRPIATDTVVVIRYQAYEGGG
ncbi:MAG: transglycosylase domain-containing protein [Actinomycetota bacterium]